MYNQIYNNVLNKYTVTWNNNSCVNVKLVNVYPGMTEILSQLEQKYATTWVNVYSDISWCIYDMVIIPRYDLNVPRHAWITGSVYYLWVKVYHYMS